MTTAQAIIARPPIQPGTLQLSLEPINLDPPAADEIFVDIWATGICHTDVVLGSVPDGTLGIRYPKILGHEGSGIVRAVGSNVETIQPGDAVLLSFYSCGACEQCETGHPAYCKEFASENYIGRQHSTKIHSTGEKVFSRFFGQSSFASSAVVSKQGVVRATELLADIGELKIFAALGCGFQTGMGAIENIARAGADDVVMILGLGAVGMAALMTAKIQNCRAIVAVDRVHSRLDIARSLGATHTIDTSSPGFTTLDQALAEMLPPGVSVVIETTGVPALLKQSIKASKPRGKVVCLGIPPWDYRLSIDLTQYINSGMSIMGCIEGDCDPQKAIPQMIQWYREGQFPIDRLVQCFKATEYEQAMAAMKDGSAIKPVLVWTEK
ncbi:chaperonin 10-like protein [Aspergillus unguis]